jgi:hypothetical protein
LGEEVEPVFELPQGFAWVREGRLWAVVREDVREALLPLLRAWRSGRLSGGRLLPGGRGGVRAFAVGERWSVVLRPSRRGGWLGRLNRSVHLGWRPRPVMELALIERLRLAKIPTIEPLAAAVDWLIPGCYRGAFVSREIPLAVTLWQYLCEVEPAERERICQTAARVTRQLHDAGVIHPDLNLQNYLVRSGVAGREVLIIDFDRARQARPSARDRQAAFERLARSMRKLDPEAAVLTLGCVEAFHAVAEPGGEE